MDIFQQVTDSLTSSFLESDPMDGDQLVSGIVDAFNALAASIGQASPQPPEAVPTLAAGEPSDPIPAAVEQPIAIAPPEPPPAAEVPASDAPIVEVPTDTPPVSDSADNVLTPSPEADEASTEESVADSAQGAADEPETVATTEPPEATEPSQSETPTAGVATQPDATSVMLQVRLRVVQSLRQLVKVFDSGSSTTTVSQSFYRASADLSLRYGSLTSAAGQAPDALAALPTSTIDAEA